MRNRTTPTARVTRVGTAALTGLATALAGLLLAPAAPAVVATPAAAADGPAAIHAPGSRRTSPDLDVLFIGAHPDDEAFALSTYGQWAEDHGVRTGVITITRGEGGGNAVGPEEGPALGLIREAEERRAVGRAGITDVYDLDKVDFYYTVSAPLTEQVWGHDDTLARVVRVIRETRPEVIVTMDPAPSPGNHGNHQYAGRMAFEGYRDAGDPSAYPGQLTRGLRAWTPSKLMLGSARGTASSGPDCPTTFVPERASQDVYGVWSGRRSAAQGDTWAQIAREAQREYASQGWSVFPDEPSDPAQLGCTYLTQVASRVPFTRGDQSPASASPVAALYGAVVRAPRGLPLGTGLTVTPRPFAVTPGGTTTVAVRVTAPRLRALARVRLTPTVPEGWTVRGARRVGRLAPGAGATRTFRVTAPADAATNERVLFSVRLGAERGRLVGTGDTELEVTPLVGAQQQLLPQVRDFEQWTRETGFPQLTGFVKPVLSLAAGGSRTVSVTVTNASTTTRSGQVRLDLPDGFTADPAVADYTDLAAGATTTVDVTVTNTDASLPTANEGGTDGDYDYAIVTTAGGTSSTSAAALELVPATTVPEVATAPTLDGVVSPGEYAGSTLDLSRLWEGEACTDAADCSATGHLVRHGDDLYVAVEVTDDVLGTVLDAADCKRHWRTDSVELALDPAGRSENTSTTFKTGILPVTTEGGPCFERDADAHQGPGEETAPGMQVASRVSSPYDGYVIEAKIPATLLPATVDPAHLGFDAFVYDSDTQDRTGQTRLGWSTYGGVQGDPYRWGVATTPGWTPPTVTATDPVIPTEALQSVSSPQSIAQAVRTGVPLAGGPAADPRRSATARWARPVGAGGVAVGVRVRGPGTAHVFVVDRSGAVLGSRVADLTRGRAVVRVPLATAPPAGSRVLLAYAADAGGTTSSAVRLRRTTR